MSAYNYSNMEEHIMVELNSTFHSLLDIIQNMKSAILTLPPPPHSKTGEEKLTPDNSNALYYPMPRKNNAPKSDLGEFTYIQAHRDCINKMKGVFDELTQKLFQFFSSNKSFEFSNSIIMNNSKESPNKLQKIGSPKLVGSPPDKLQRLTADEQLNLKDTQIQKLTERIGQLKKQIYSMRTSYFKELQRLREINYKRSKMECYEYLDVRYFQSTEGLDEDIMNILNGKLNELKDLYNSQLQNMNTNIDKMHKKITAYKNLQPKHFGMVDMSTIEIIKNLSVIETDPFAIWDAIANVYGSDFFHQVLEAEYGDLNNMSEIIVQQVEKFKKECEDNIDELQKNHDLQLKTLNDQIKFYKEEYESMAEKYQNECDGQRNKIMTEAQQFYTKKEVELYKKYEAEKHELYLSLGTQQEKDRNMANQYLRMMLIKWRFFAKIAREEERLRNLLEAEMEREKILASMSQNSNNNKPEQTNSKEENSGDQKPEDQNQKKENEDQKTEKEKKQQKEDDEAMKHPVQIKYQCLAEIKSKAQLYLTESSLKTAHDDYDKLLHTHHFTEYQVFLFGKQLAEWRNKSVNEEEKVKIMKEQILDLKEENSQIKIDLETAKKVNDYLNKLVRKVGEGNIPNIKDDELFLEHMNALAQEEVGMRKNNLNPGKLNKRPERIPSMNLEAIVMNERRSRSQTIHNPNPIKKRTPFQAAFTFLIRNKNLVELAEKKQMIVRKRWYGLPKKNRNVTTEIKNINVEIDYVKNPISLEKVDKQMQTEEIQCIRPKKEDVVINQFMSEAFIPTEKETPKPRAQDDNIRRPKVKERRGTAEPRLRGRMRQYGRQNSNDVNSSSYNSRLQTERVPIKPIKEEEEPPEKIKNKEAQLKKHISSNRVQSQLSNPPSSKSPPPASNPTTSKSPTHQASGKKSISFLKRVSKPLNQDLRLVQNNNGNQKKEEDKEVKEIKEELKKMEEPKEEGVQSPVQNRIFSKEARPSKEFITRETEKSIDYDFRIGELTHNTSFENGILERNELTQKYEHNQSEDDFNLRESILKDYKEGIKNVSHEIRKRNNQSVCPLLSDESLFFKSANQHESTIKKEEIIHPEKYYHAMKFLKSTDKDKYSRKLTVQQKERLYPENQPEVYKRLWDDISRKKERLEDVRNFFQEMRHQRWKEILACQNYTTNVHYIQNPQNTSPKRVDEYPPLKGTQMNHSFSALGRKTLADVSIFENEICKKTLTESTFIENVKKPSHSKVQSVQTECQIDDSQFANAQMFEKIDQFYKYGKRRTVSQQKPYRGTISLLSKTKSMAPPKTASGARNKNPSRSFIINNSSIQADSPEMTDNNEMREQLFDKLQQLEIEKKRNLRQLSIKMKQLTQFDKSDNETEGSVFHLSKNTLIEKETNKSRKAVRTPENPYLNRKKTRNVRISHKSLNTSELQTLSSNSQAKTSNLKSSAQSQKNEPETRKRISVISKSNHCKNFSISFIEKQKK